MTAIGCRSAPPAAPRLPLGIVDPRPAAAGPLRVRRDPGRRATTASPEADRTRFWSTDWQVSAQSNRHGYRLLGPVLDGYAGGALRSCPVVPA